ncbi:MAG TPA: ATP-binding cassette domain-containing protein, partial [Candidatus Aminicenantes bacterium]|nr:ATP-binding cassette domain-containing protein [Candidatus Aminicenantes bacterium]
MKKNPGNQVIFSMVEVGKVVPPSRWILKDISISFFYGAKIGVLGANGAGKSSLLRIIAGQDADIVGEVVRSRDYSVGLLDQEPKLDPQKTVLEVVKEGAQVTVDLLAEFDRVNEKFGDPDLSPDDMEKLIARQAEIQEKLEELDAWELDNRLEMAMDALRCPPAETPVT